MNGHKTLMIPVDVRPIAQSCHLKVLLVIGKVVGSVHDASGWDQRGRVGAARILPPWQFVLSPPHAGFATIASGQKAGKGDDLDSTRQPAFALATGKSKSRS